MRGYTAHTTVIRLTRGGLIAGAAVALLAAASAPASAAGLSASELAGPGAGFRDLSIDPGTRAPAPGAVGGILGGFGGDGRGRDTGPEVRLRPVTDDAVAPARTLPALPRVQSLAPPAATVTPSIRLRPVGETLPVPAAAGPGPTPNAGFTQQPPTPGPAPAAAPPAPDPDAPAPTLIRADSLRYERDLGLYTARGHVELTNGPRVVLADMVSYNERTDTLTANGNVRVVEEDGTTYYANYAELSADFKDGFVRDMSVLLADRSRIAAVYATRTKGERKDFWKGVYTACDTCPPSEGSIWPTLSGNEQGTRDRMPPAWQIRAAHVTHDEVARDIIYRDATLEVFGVPVAYTPYLSQPDPTVYRRSGLLAPTFGADSGMGYWTEVPYYAVIDDHQDATLAVRAMSEEAWLLRPEYRLRFADGEFSMAGSFTDDGDKGLTGHLNSMGRWHINDVWRAGFDSELVSFDGYLDRYNFPRPTWLTNHAWVEAFSGRSYAAIEGFHFNDTRNDLDDAENPIVLPLMTYDYESDPGWFGGQALLDGSLQSIYREDGASGTRLSGSIGWRLPGTTGWGLAYEAETRLNADIYSVENANVIEGAPRSGFDGMVSRLYPSARLTLRYPMIRIAPQHRQILEPVVALSMMPPGLNTNRIPNEDSLDPELHVANLLTGNRTAGRDRIDDGVSANYGLRWTYLDDEGGQVQAMIGQAYRVLGDDADFPRQAGYGTGLSDYVGSLDVRPNPYLDLFARVRLDRDTLEPNTAVLGFRGGTGVLNVSGTYVNTTDLDAQDGSNLPRREELVASVGTAFSRYWNAYAGGRYDYVNDRTVDVWGGVSYEDECLVVALDYTTSYNEVDGEDEGESVVLRVTLKTLGEISF